MIVKYVRNSRKTGNSVSARRRYIVGKSDWVYENTLERFDFAVKRRFGNKQDTTHYVVSFDRLLSDKEKEKARELVSDFFFQKFGMRHFLSIAEHNNNGYTHYHILLSRDIETGKMVNSTLKAKEYRELQREIREVFERAGLLSRREKKINREYLNSTEVGTNLEVWQYKDYEKALDILIEGEYEDLENIKSYKGLAKAIAEVISLHLEKENIMEVERILEKTGARIYTAKAKKRERVYLELGNVKVRIDRLSKGVVEDLKQFFGNENERENENKQRRKRRKNRNWDVDMDRGHEFR